MSQDGDDSFISGPVMYVTNQAWNEFSYTGEMVQGHWHGHGDLTVARGPKRGERYWGTFRKDEKDGFGVYTWRNGDSYCGMWRQDLRHGLVVCLIHALDYVPHTAVIIYD